MSRNYTGYNLITHADVFIIAGLPNAMPKFYETWAY